MCNAHHGKVAGMHPLQVTCPVCQAQPGIACHSPKFPHLIVEHHARMASTHKGH